jgi:hypothetical protein
MRIEQLRAGLERVSAAVPFYRQRFREAGVSTGDIRSVDDLGKLPFTTKQDLRDHYPFGLLAVPMKAVVRIHASSGTTGKPTVAAYTRDDIALWSELMARTYAGAGVTDSDVVHNAYGYGLFTGGLGFHYGAERLGAAVIPMSGGNTRRQLMLNARLRIDGPMLHAVVRAAARRGGGRRGRGSSELAVESRSVWRGAVVGSDEARNRGPAGHSRPESLRTFGNHRTGRGRGMHASAGTAYFVSAENCDAETSAIVASYARNCSEGTIQAKILLNMAFDMTHGQFFEEYLRRQRLALASPDHREAMSAYREHRAPQFLS